MDAEDEEASRTGKLRAGLRTVAGVVTQDVYDRLLAQQRERGIPTMSRVVGFALQEWARGMASSGFRPGAVEEEGVEVSGGNMSLKPAEPREATLSPWQEVRGLVKEVRQEGQHLCVVLRDGGDLLAVRLPKAVGGPRIAPGSRIAILRTDTPPGYVMRPLS